MCVWKHSGNTVWCVCLLARIRQSAHWQWQNINRFWASDFLEAQPYPVAASAGSGCCRATSDQAYKCGLNETVACMDTIKYNAISSCTIDVWEKSRLALSTQKAASALPGTHPQRGTEILAYGIRKVIPSWYLYHVTHHGSLSSNLVSTIIFLAKTQVGNYPIQSCPMAKGAHNSLLRR
jgi:hypothetical protein